MAIVRIGEIQMQSVNDSIEEMSAMIVKLLQQKDVRKYLEKRRR